MNQTPKSALTAGLLGIFLGVFGVHNFYLGDKKKGIIHVAMSCGGILLQIIFGIITTAGFFRLSGIAIFGILSAAAGLAITASGIWGLIEGIIILTEGDAGLARKGFPVATPVAPQGYPMQGQYGYGQPMQQPMQPMQQPVQPVQQPVQPMPGQPMQQPIQPQQPAQPEQPASMPTEPTQAE